MSDLWPYGRPNEARIAELATSAGPGHLALLKVIGPERWLGHLERRMAAIQAEDVKGPIDTPPDPAATWDSVTRPIDTVSFEQLALEQRIVHDRSAGVYAPMRTRPLPDGTWQTPSNGLAETAAGDGGLEAGDEAPDRQPDPPPTIEQRVRNGERPWAEMRALSLKEREELWHRLGYVLAVDGEGWFDSDPCAPWNRRRQWWRCSGDGPPRPAF